MNWSQRGEEVEYGEVIHRGAVGVLKDVKVHDMNTEEVRYLWCSKVEVVTDVIDLGLEAEASRRELRSCYITPYPWEGGLYDDVEEAEKFLEPVEPERVK